MIGRIFEIEKAGVDVIELSADEAWGVSQIIDDYIAEMKTAFAAADELLEILIHPVEGVDNPA